MESRHLSSSFLHSSSSECLLLSRGQFTRECKASITRSTSATTINLLFSHLHYREISPQWCACYHMWCSTTCPRIPPCTTQRLAFLFHFTPRTHNTPFPPQTCPPPAGIQVLPPGAGYGFIIGIGGLFAAPMLAITHLQEPLHGLLDRPSGGIQHRVAQNVKPGLMAAGIVVELHVGRPRCCRAAPSPTATGIGRGPCGTPPWRTFQILLFAPSFRRRQDHGHRAGPPITFPEIVPGQARQVRARDGFVSRPC